MAHIVTWYRCPVCNQAYDNEREAMRCRNQHPIRSELWAIGKGGKGVRILEELERKESHEPDKN